jgi:hypothetical protein
MLKIYKIYTTRLDISNGLWYIVHRKGDSNVDGKKPDSGQLVKVNPLEVLTGDLSGGRKCDSGRQD